MPHRLRLVSILLGSILVLALAAQPAASLDRDTSMGTDGEIYMVREGLYGELFAGQGLADPGNPALALDVARPDQKRERLLVPGTETADAEDSASIFFEDQSGTLFVLWQSKVNVIHSRLNLIGLHGAEWTDPIEISGNPFGWKSSPQLAVTRDTFRTQRADGSLRTWKRTVVHLLWWEEGPAGESITHYSPVTLLDGVYTGWNPVYRLDELAAGSGPGSLADGNAQLAKAPRIEPGRNAQSVVMAFVLPESGELATAAVEILPGEISFLADAVRAQIVDLGRNPSPDGPGSLAKKARAQIVDLGRKLSLHPGLSTHLAENVAATIEAAPPWEPASSLAERVRAQIVDLGARMSDRGLDRASAAYGMAVLETPNQGGGAPSSHIRLVEASVRPAPRTGGVDNALFLSQAGREVVASWTEGDVVYFRESRGQGWSEARPLRLGGELDLGRAREILARRADERSDE